MIFEYPGYGIYKYKDKQCCAEEIIRDAEIIYNFLNTIMDIKEKNIIIMGRCIGSGPAVHLSHKYKPSCLVLISAFTSLKEAIKSIFKKFKLGWFLEKIVKER